VDQLWLEADRGNRAPGASPGSRTDEDAGGRGRRLVCAHCRARITTDDQRIEVAGKHEHFFVNPDGFDFHIGCFGAAPGVISAGRTTDEFTWFAGHTWQLDLCRGCTHHLGWIFRSPNRIFHGLILDRLAEDDDDET
jgi:hypothetical protein